MKNKIIVEKLLDIKKQISDLGIEYLETQMPVALSDIGKTLKPFVEIGSSLDQSIKKLSSDVTPGSIPKSNNFQS
jgi:hypothetical protein